MSRQDVLDAAVALSVVIWEENSNLFCHLICGSCQMMNQGQRFLVLFSFNNQQIQVSLLAGYVNHSFCC